MTAEDIGRAVLWSAISPQQTVERWRAHQTIARLLPKIVNLAIDEWKRVLSDQDIKDLLVAFPAIGEHTRTKALQGELDRRAAGTPLPPAPVKHPETPIERAVHRLPWLCDPLGHVPHKREPGDPIAGVVAERWAMLPDTARFDIREAMTVLNIPLQEGLL